MGKLGKGQGKEQKRFQTQRPHQLNSEGHFISLHFVLFTVKSDQMYYGCVFVRVTGWVKPPSSLQQARYRGEGVTSAGGLTPSEDLDLTAWIRVGQKESHFSPKRSRIHLLTVSLAHHLVLSLLLYFSLPFLTSFPLPSAAGHLS